MSFFHVLKVGESRVHIPRFLVHYLTFRRYTTDGQLHTSLLKDFLISATNNSGKVISDYPTHMCIYYAKIHVERNEVKDSH